MTVQEILQMLGDKLMKRLGPVSGSSLIIATDDSDFFWTIPSLLSVLQTLSGQGKITFSLYSDNGEVQQYLVTKV